MSTAMPSNGPSKFAYYAGWVLSVLPVALLIFSGGLKLAGPPEIREGLVQNSHYPESVIVPLGVIEIVAALVYLFPKTAYFGAIVLTGYLGGAVATHLVQNEIPQAFAPVLFGVLIWLGLYLRDPRFRQLAPINR